MKHRRLLSIDLVHDYFADGRCRGLSLRPQPACARKLAGRRMLARGRADGLDLLVEVDPSNHERPLISLGEDLHLRFDLCVDDPELPLYTDLQALRALATPRLRNAAGSLELSLEQDEPEAPRAREALACVELVDLDPAWISDPPRLSARLSASTPRWTYYCVGTSAAPTITDADPERGEQPIIFETEAAPEAASEDRVAASLAAQFPDRPRWRLTSSEALPCRAAPRRHLSLSVGESVLHTELPNPALRNHSVVIRDDIAQDTLYQIIVL
ncbi:hypothetical protein G6O69_35975 [Pseudenhygromyxa sp. WMMC2535]|uniref:hypothetical protein n=1 Tax=Pseudenhygromyxa sp. WMMC2535 TaxID=2712867 RepID=UPI0015540654|nr:hypothetical protein [Pseudenhygromyxa sp. WMMC2535]NVB43279.1 hypothetical protein [Pseudenhygromyxa sp. WMMC2535]